MNRPHVASIRQGQHHSLVALICILILAGGCRKEKTAASDAPLRIQTEVSQTQPMSDRVLTAAQVEVARWQSLYFQIGGTVEKVLVTEAATMKKGALLAELNTASQRNQVEKARLSLERSRLNEEQTRHDLENGKKLLDTDGISEEQILDLEQQLKQAVIAREQSELSLNDQEIRLSQMQLRAPYDGLVSEVNIRVGDLVRGPVADPDKAMSFRAPMVVIDPNSPRTIRAQLPEGRARAVVVGTPAEVALMEYQTQTLHAVVTAVAETVDRETRTVSIQLAVTEPEGGYPATLRDGSAALVTFLTEQREDAVTVAEQSLYYYNDQAYVFVVDGHGKVARRPVRQGTLQGGRVEIVSGLKAKERVARSHLYLLRDGQTVLTEESL